MIDGFFSFTKGGLVLWSIQLVRIKGDPIDKLIKNVLLEERTGETSATFDLYNLKWFLRNDLELFFVAVYQGIMQMTYLDHLLQLAAEDFTKLLPASVKPIDFHPVNYDQRFRMVLQKADKAFTESKQKVTMKTFAETQKGKAVLKGKEGKEKDGMQGDAGRREEPEEGVDDDADDDGIEASRRRLRQRAKGKAPAPKPVDKGAEKKSRLAKAPRNWLGADNKVTSSAIKALDRSKEQGDVDVDKARYLDDDANSMSEISSLESRSDDEAPKPKGIFHRLTSGVKNLTGGAVLTAADLDPLMKTFATELMTKNVAADVVQKISESVMKNLVGTKTEKFVSVHATVKKALIEAIEVILTPKKSVDVLRAALATKAQKRVYTIVFLGVNGVGKSTNLAKVAYYLKNKGNLNVMIAACDTFRSGAVEQLRTHARCLDCHLFERGYGKDPADIAKNAISYAESNDYDVVLVDTAGRMQDNEPLMKALAKLVMVNNPDLVLFVGEALVGNDAIDQVTKFNRSLVDMSHDRANPRGLDGMLLTKYDTVDDKVGAALSMVYITGQPVVFVGTGQKYTHLRKLEARELVKTLLG